MVSAQVQYFDSASNEWITTVPQSVQEAQRHVSGPDFFSAGVLCFNEGILECTRSQRLPNRLYKKLKGTLMLLMRDIRNQSPGIIHWQKVSSPIIDALKNERIIQSTYALVELEEVSGAGLSTLIMWDVRYAASPVKQLAVSSKDNALVRCGIDAHVVFLRGVVQGTHELAILSAYFHRAPPSSSTGVEGSSNHNTRAKHLETWRELHALGCKAMEKATSNVMIISNITEVAHSVTFEDADAPGVSGPETVMLRGIAEARTAVTLFTMGSRLAPRRLSPFVATKLHSRNSAGGGDLMLCAKVFTLGLPPQEGRKVGGIQPPRAIGVGDRVKKPVPCENQTTRSTVAVADKQKPRWSIDHSAVLRVGAVRSREGLFDLTSFAPSINALVDILNKGDESNKPLAIGMDVSAMVDTSSPSSNAVEILWPFSYAIHGQTLLAENRATPSLAAFTSYADGNKRIVHAKKQLQQLVQSKTPEPSSGKSFVTSPTSTTITSSSPLPLSPLAPNPYAYSAAQPPMDALRAAQEESLHERQHRQLSSPSNAAVASFPRRRRQWNINHATLLYQVTPIETQLDISTQIGVIRNALASAVSRLNGHAEPQENAVPALRAAIHAERAKSSPIVLPTTAQGDSENGFSLFQERPGLLLDLSLNGDSGIVDPLVSFPYDYALVYSHEFEAYWLLATIDVPCDVSVCQAYVRELEQTICA